MKNVKKEAPLQRQPSPTKKIPQSSYVAVSSKSVYEEEKHSAKEVNPPDSLFLRSTDDKSGKFFLSLTASHSLIETSKDSIYRKYRHMMKTKVIKKEPLPKKWSPSQ